MARQAGHHTVPQFYLRRFGDPANVEEARIVAWDKARDEQLPPQRTANVAKIRDFYSIPGHTGGESQVLEDSIARFEGIWAEALRCLDNGLPVDTETRYYIAHFIAFQFIRTTRSRRLVTDTTADLTKWLGTMSIKAIRNRGGDPAVRRWFRELSGSRDLPDEDVDRLVSMIESQSYETEGFDITVGPEGHLGLVLRALDGESEFIRYVYQRNWSIVQATEPAVFVTSDHPVTLVASPSVGSVGLGTAEQIVLPLTPRTCLLMDYGDTGDSPTTSIPADQVRSTNLRTIAVADKWVYLHPDTPESSIRG